MLQRPHHAAQFREPLEPADRGIARLGAAAEIVEDVLTVVGTHRNLVVGAARGLEVQQIDTGAFADDERQHRWLESAGFERVRTWWQMNRPVTPDEAHLVPDPGEWESDGARFRLVRRTAMQTAVRMITTGVMLALLAGIAIKLKIFGGSP